MKGRYLVGDVVETFTCGDGSYLGLREDGDRIELLADGRLVALHDGWEVRGGRVGPDLLWARGTEERSAKAVAFTGSSPAYDVALAQLLGLAVGERRKVTLVEISEPVAAARTVEHAWARTDGPEPDVDRYEVADLQTAERWVLHLSGDILVSREGARVARLVALAG